MELAPRTTAPAHATGAVEFIDLVAVSEDDTFRLREEGDVSALAASIGRLGQLVPLELRPREAPEGGPPRYQVVAGFRRVAALRLLRRERALARVHPAMPDEDAWAMALAQALLGEPLLRTEVSSLRERLAREGQAPWAADLLDEATLRAPLEPGLRERFLEFLAAAREAEDGAPVEVTPEELASDVARRLYEVNADLAVAFEAWADLPPDGRRAILAQARWIAGLLPMLEGDRGE
jgi:ParB-like chromosome segregation protein Spo0J